jgi:disease resistance protein RPS2
LSLFIEKVTEDTIMSHPQIKECALGIMKKLGGLPLALITVGRAMYNKHDPGIWENTLVRLQQAQTNDGESPSSIESVFRRLSFSYENLNSIQKDCFLLCSLWPEDHCIKRNELVEFWMGQGLINDFDIRKSYDKPEIQSAYNVGYTYIKKLQDVCLLEEGEEDGPELSVKMHDVIRDMALWIANNQGSGKNKWIVPVCTNYASKDINVPPNTEKLSLIDIYQNDYNISFSSTSCSPKLSIFLHLSENLLKDFPAGICKLVNLQFLNLSNNEIQLLPEELATLINLRYLLIRGNGIRTISDEILFKLIALRVLDISGFYLDDVEKLVVPSLLEELKLLADFQALGITIAGMKQFHMLNTFSVPTRWLEVTINSTIPLDTFSLGNYQMQNNLFSLKITVGRGMQHLQFDSTYGSPCNLGRLEQLTFSNYRGKMKDILWNNLKPN